MRSLLALILLAICLPSCKPRLRVPTKPATGARWLRHKPQPRIPRYYRGVPTHRSEDAERRHRERAGTRFRGRSSR